MPPACKRAAVRAIAAPERAAAPVASSPGKSLGDETRPDFAILHQVGGNLFVASIGLLLLPGRVGALDMFSPSFGRRPELSVRYSFFCLKR